jgi:LysM repeat protein
MLAPLALIVCAFAVFAVVSSSGDNGNSKSTSGTGSQSGRSADSSGAASGAAPAGGAAVTNRATYKVKPGDSFAAIAENLNIDVDKLKLLNPTVDARALQPGQKLKLK